MHSADAIAGALTRQLFQRNALVVVPRCYFTGHECDLLVVTRDLRLIDVEIKTSVADLRADIKKDKWWQTTEPFQWRSGGGVFTRHRRIEPRLREWPPKIWKHYYALPAMVWRPELAESVPKASGVLTLKSRGIALQVDVVRRSTPCKDAEKIDTADVMNLARLTGLRLWDALAQIQAKANKGLE